MIIFVVLFAYIFASFMIGGVNDSLSMFLFWPLYLVRGIGRILTDGSIPLWMGATYDVLGDAWRKFKES